MTNNPSESETVEAVLAAKLVLSSWQHRVEGDVGKEMWADIEAFEAAVRRETAHPFVDVMERYLAAYTNDEGCECERGFAYCDEDPCFAGEMRAVLAAARPVSASGGTE